MQPLRISKRRGITFSSSSQQSTAGALLPRYSIVRTRWGSGRILSASPISTLVRTPSSPVGKTPTPEAHRWPVGEPFPLHFWISPEFHVAHHLLSAIIRCPRQQRHFHETLLLVLTAAMTRQLDELMKVLVTELRSNPATALDASPLTHTPRFASLASHQSCRAVRFG